MESCTGHLFNAFDQSSLAKFCCQISFKPSTINLLVLSDAIKKQIQQRTVFSWKEFAGQLVLQLDVNRVMFVKVQHGLISIHAVAESGVPSTIILTFELKQAKQNKFWFVRNLCHYEQMDLLPQKAPFKSNFDFDQYRRLFYAYGHCLPTFYINDRLLKSTKTKDLLDVNISDDLRDDYEKILTEMNETIVKKFPEGDGRIQATFEETIAVYVRVRFNLKI